MYIDYIWDYSCAVEVYIGSDINGQPDRPDKISNKPTRYPNGENRTTRTRPDSEPDTKWVTKFPGHKLYPKNASIL